MAKKSTRLERLAAEIEACRDSRGRVSPKAVVAAAKRDKNSQLYREFDWDDRSAAQWAREETARRLFREVKIEIVREGKVLAVVPRYVSDPDASSQYVQTIKVATNHDKSVRVLHDELDRIEAAANRAIGLGIAFGIDAQLERILEEVQRAKVRVK